MNKKAKLVQEYRRERKILQKRADNLLNLFKQIAQVPIEKADYKREEMITAKIAWLNRRIENLDNKIIQLEEGLHRKVIRTVAEILDPIISSFKGAN